jgi:tRNA (guanine37-N1)-methyltransferase
VKRIDIFTLVPDAFGWFRLQHPVADAVVAGLVCLEVQNIRDHTPLNHRQVDDAPYGGGPGMVLRVDVVAAALQGVFGVAAERVRDEREVIVLTPGGRPFDDVYAAELARGPRDVVLLAGRYEGFDARVTELFASADLSIGPFVLAGGEVAAMAVVEAVVRKVPGVLGNEESVVEESFSEELGGAVEYPHYTRPREFAGVQVPEILISGNHAAIARWRREHARPSQWVRPYVGA